MKKISIVFLMFILGINNMWAQWRSLEDAMSISVHHFEEVDKSSGFGIVPQLAYSKEKDGHVLLSVFNNEGPAGGFVIVGGYEGASAILGYSDSGKFDSVTSPAPLTRLIYSYISDVSELPGTDVALKAVCRTDLGIFTSIPAMVKSYWDQDFPYNLSCPEIGGERTLVGCNAVAVGQIMMYHKFPDCGQGESCYRMRNGMEICADFSVPIDWENILESYETMVTSNQQKKAVADMLSNVGISLVTEYGLDASEASSESIPWILNSVWKYSNTAATVRRDFFSRDQYIGIIYEQLAQGLPVVMSGWSSQTGHSFIIDGYENGLFHVNWGWGGSCDGFYDIDIMSPKTDDGYNMYSEAHINLAPDTLDCDLSPLVAASGLWKQSVHNYSRNSNVAVAGKLTNFSVNHPDGQLSVMATDSETGNVCYAQPVTISVGCQETEYVYVECSLPTWIEGHKYVLTPVFRSSEDDDWQSLIMDSEQEELSCVASDVPDDDDFSVPLLWDKADFHVDGFYYKKTSDSEVCIISPIGNDGTYELYTPDILYMPSLVEYEGNTYSVTSIADYAFYDQLQYAEYSAVVLPSTLKSIGKYAFYNCPRLNVFVPESVETIGKGALNCALDVYLASTDTEKMKFGSGVFPMDAVFVVNEDIYDAVIDDAYWKGYEIERYCNRNGLSFYISTEYNDAAVLIPNMIKGYDGKYVGNIVIPGTIECNGQKYPVNGGFGLMHLPDLKAVESYVSILQIYDCANLKSVIFKDVGSIYCTVQGCPLLDSLTVPDYVAEVGITGDINSIDFLNPDPFSIMNIPYAANIYFHTPIPPHAENIAGLRLKVHIPVGSIERYRQSEFRDNVLIEDIPPVIAPNLVSIQNFTKGEISRFGMGFGSPFTKELAVKAPESLMQAYRGDSISQIMVYGIGRKSGEPPHQYVFVKKTDDSDYLAKVPVDKPAGGWTRISFPQPVAIDGDELFIGFGCDSSENLEIPFVDWDNDIYAPCYYRFLENSLSGWNTEIRKSIPIRYSITTKSLPESAAILYMNVSDTEMLPEYSESEDEMCQTVKCRLFIQNHSAELLTSCTISIMDNGNEICTYDAPVSLLTNEVSDIQLEFGLDRGQRTHNLSARVTAINGIPDLIYDDLCMPVDYVTKVLSDEDMYEDDSFTRHFVIEQTCATWCGFCPRGLAAFECLKADYPNIFIPLSMHVDDEMDIAENYDGHGSVPECTINRDSTFSSNYVEMVKYIEKHKGMADAKISVTADYIKETNLISICSKTVFRQDMAMADYAVAYAILEDGVGPYNQTNNYDGGNNGKMYGWENRSGENTVYDDVVRGFYNALNGCDGRLPANIIGMQEYTHQYSIPIPQSVGKKENCRLVAMIIDRRTGKIVNAVQTGFVEHTPDTGIKASSVNEVNGYSYSVDGLIQNTIHRGIRIERRGDDGVVKILVE